MNKHNNVTTLNDVRKEKQLLQEAVSRRELGLTLTAQQKRALLRHKTFKAVRSNYATT